MVSIISTLAGAENSIIATNNFVKHVKIFVFSVRCHLITCPILLNFWREGNNWFFSESCEKRFIHCQLQRMGLFLDEQAIVLSVFENACVIYIWLSAEIQSIFWYFFKLFLLFFFFDWFFSYKQYNFRWNAQRET